MAFDHSEIEKLALSTVGTVTLLSILLRIVVLVVAQDLIGMITEIRRSIAQANNKPEKMMKEMDKE